MLYEAGPICLTMGYKTLRFIFAVQFETPALHHRPEPLKFTLLRTSDAYNVAGRHPATDNYAIAAHSDGNRMTQHTRLSGQHSVLRVAQDLGGLAAAAVKSL